MSKKHKGVYFNENFTFINESETIRRHYGFKAFNSRGEHVGLVFSTDDERSAAFEHAELCMLPAYYDRYGEWHRIKSYGGRIKWALLCERVQTHGRYTVHID